MPVDKGGVVSLDFLQKRLAFETPVLYREAGR